MVKRILKHFLEFFIRTLSIYSLYIGLKIFYNVEVGLEWIGFVILVGIAQSITERNAIEKERKKLLSKIKHSQMLQPGDEFIYPVSINNRPVKKTILTVVKKDDEYIYTKTKKEDCIKIPIELLDCDCNVTFL